MTQDKDKLLMRSKDVVLIVGAVLGLLAGVGKIYVLANSVEEQKEQLEKIVPRVSELQTRAAINDERWTQIQEDIRWIKRSMPRRVRTDD